MSKRKNLQHKVNRSLQTRLLPHKALLDKRFFTVFPMDFALQVTKTCVWKQLERPNRSIYADVYVPREKRGLMPIMAFLHGGAWMCGSRTDYCHVLFNSFAILGFLIVSFDYELLPEASHENQLENVRDMEHFLRRQLQQEFQDLSLSQTIIVVGASSGAQLALLTVRQLFCLMLL